MLWALADDDRLPPAVRTAIVDPANLVAVSAASVWEISIKRSLGRLVAPDDLLGALSSTELEPLPVRAEHAQLAGNLPLHHRDPFDRMLVAQASIEGLTIATRDTRIPQYGVPVLWD